MMCAFAIDAWCVNACQGSDWLTLEYKEIIRSTWPILAGLLSAWHPPVLGRGCV